VSELVLLTLIHAWQTLQPLGMPMAVAGGLAVGLWKNPRGTRDVDLLIMVDPSKLPELLSAVSAAGMRPRTHSFPLELGGIRVALFDYRIPDTFMDIHVDLLFADDEYHSTAVSRRVPALLPINDLEVDVLAIEDLIIHKLIANRMIDRADVVALLQANRSKIDFDYLKHWIDKLKLNALFAELWQHAFPSEPLPEAFT
jgi:hypothetical protein